MLDGAVLVLCAVFGIQVSPLAMTYERLPLWGCRPRVKRLLSIGKGVGITFLGYLDGHLCHGVLSRLTPALF